MRRCPRGIVLVVVVAAAVAACASSTSSPSPSPTPSTASSPSPFPSPSQAPSPTPTLSPTPTPAGATGFAEYATASCSAWGTLFRVVGNPDTAGWTDGVHQLQAAATARDQATAARLQGEINTELEAARRQIAYAAGWPPASRPMAQMDRFFVATETWITAYVDVAKGVPNAPDPQAAFEAAGGVVAWRALFETYADLASFRPSSVARCPGAPITP